MVSMARTCATLAAGFTLAFSTAGWGAADRYGPPVTIVIQNISSAVSDADAAAWAQAIQRQAHEDVAPVWKVDADIRFGDAARDGDWVCRIEDPPANGGNMIGQHFIRDTGAPGCALYVREGLAASDLPRYLSHEIVEMLVDPWLSSVTFAPSSIPNGVTVYLREVCDPVAAYWYEIDGVRLADFTYPDFWLRGTPVGKKLDHLSVARIPLEPTAHSYMLVRQITQFGGIDSIDVWSYIWGSYCTFGPC